MNQPTKQQIRNYMIKRSESHKPPPSLKEIRRRLRWVKQESPPSS